MKNLEYVVRKTALELNLPEEKVRTIINAYWYKAFSGLVHLDETTVTIRHVGSFSVSRYKINNYIRKRIQKIRFLQGEPKLDEEKREEYLKYNYEKLSKALIQRNIIAKQYAKMFDNI